MASQDETLASVLSSLTPSLCTTLVVSVVSYIFGNSPVAYISVRTISRDQTFGSHSIFSCSLSSVVLPPTEVRVHAYTHSLVLTTTFP
jgi:hypothetical protein